MKQERERTRADIRGYIAFIEDLMSRQEFNHAGTPSQAAIYLWQQGGINSLADFEAHLRDVGSRVHFIAVPLDYFGDEFDTIYPVTNRESNPEYSLYVAVNGVIEASQMLQKLKITMKENQERLAVTGILVRK